MLAPLLALALAAAPTPPLPPARPAPALARAGAALEAGRPDEALASLGADRRPEARLLRGLAEEAAGRLEPALAALAGLEAPLPAVADRILSARGRVQAGLTHWREAEAAFGAVAEGSLLRGAALLGRARALEAQGDRAAALAALAPLLEARAEGPAATAPAATAQAATAEAATAPAAALLLAGRLRAALPAPDLAGARAVLLDCWAGHGAEPDSAGCLEALRALPGSAGAPPPLDEVVRRGEALVERGRPSDAVALLQPAVRAAPAPGPGQPLACRAAAALGRALRRDRQNGKSAEVLRPVVERCPAGPIRERALYVLATAAAGAGACATRRWRSTAASPARRRRARWPTTPSSPVAELQARDGRPEQARTHAGGAGPRAARRRPPRRGPLPPGLAGLAGRGGGAAGGRAPDRSTPRPTAGVDAYEHARAAYWRGRLLEARGAAGRAEARAIWRGLVEAAPADYYALLSRARLAGREDGVALPAPLGAGGAGRAARRGAGGGPAGRRSPPPRRAGRCCAPGCSGRRPRSSGRSIGAPLPPGELAAAGGAAGRAAGAGRRPPRRPPTSCGSRRGPSSGGRRRGPTGGSGRWPTRRPSPR